MADFSDFFNGLVDPLVLWQRLVLLVLFILCIVCIVLLIRVKRHNRFLQKSTNKARRSTPDVLLGQQVKQIQATPSQPGGSASSTLAQSVQKTPRPVSQQGQQPEDINTSKQTEAKSTPPSSSENVSVPTTKPIVSTQEKDSFTTPKMPSKPAFSQQTQAVNNDAIPVIDASKQDEEKKSSSSSEAIQNPAPKPVEENKPDQLSVDKIINLWKLSQDNTLSKESRLDSLKQGLELLVALPDDPSNAQKKSDWVFMFEGEIRRYS